MERFWRRASGCRWLANQESGVRYQPARIEGGVRHRVSPEDKGSSPVQHCLQQSRRVHSLVRVVHNTAVLGRLKALRFAPALTRPARGEKQWVGNSSERIAYHDAAIETNGD